MAYIYQIINDINDKIYIGKTEYSLEHRWKSHLLDFNKRSTENRPLYRAMKKYGIEHFKIELVEECDSSIVNDREIYWINKKNSYKNGYNATLGGDGRILYDHISILKLWDSGMTRKEISENIGCSVDVVTDTLKANNINGTLECSRRLKEKYSISCIMLNKDTNEIIKTFSSYTEAAQFIVSNGYTTELNIKNIGARIGQVCNGKRKTAYGFKWSKELKRSQT